MDVIDIGARLGYDSQIKRMQYHTHDAYAGSKFQNTDEIAFTIQNQDVYTLPCKSYIHIEGKLLTTAGNPVRKTKFISNAFAYLISQCRYLLNGIEIDSTRNVGYTSSMKGLASLSPDDARRLGNAGWDPEFTPTVHTDGSFTAIVPLSTLMGCFEDYKKMIVNCKQELILVRSQRDVNCIITEPPAAAAPGAEAPLLEQAKITITKMNWQMPHIEVSDSARLQILKYVQEDRPIEIGFRSWRACEKPLRPDTNTIDWQVKTSTHLERPRYVLLALQTNKRNVATADAFKFDHCKIKNVKLHLNDKPYPYNDLHLQMSKKHAAVLYEMFCNFRESYYGKDQAPLINKMKFINQLPLIVIDCNKQNEAVKSGAIDVRIEIEADESFPENTTAFCVILHDRIVDYTPLTNVVRRHN